MFCQSSQKNRIACLENEHSKLLTFAYMNPENHFRVVGIPHILHRQQQQSVYLGLVFEFSVALPKLKCPVSIVVSLEVRWRRDIFMTSQRACKQPLLKFEHSSHFPFYVMITIMPLAFYLNSNAKF